MTVWVYLKAGQEVIVSNANEVRGGELPASPIGVGARGDHALECIDTAGTQVARFRMADVSGYKIEKD